MKKIISLVFLLFFGVVLTSCSKSLTTISDPLNDMDLITDESTHITNYNLISYSNDEYKNELEIIKQHKDSDIYYAVSYNFAKNTIHFVEFNDTINVYTGIEFNNKNKEETIEFFKNFLHIVSNDIEFNPKNINRHKFTDVNQTYIYNVEDSGLYYVNLVSNNNLNIYSLPDAYLKDKLLGYHKNVGVRTNFIGYNTTSDFNNYSFTVEPMHINEFLPHKDLNREFSKFTYVENDIFSTNYLISNKNFYIKDELCKIPIHTIINISDKQKKIDLSLGLDSVNININIIPIN